MAQIMRQALTSLDALDGRSSSSCGGYLTHHVINGHGVSGPGESYGGGSGNAVFSRGQGVAAPGESNSGGDAVFSNTMVDVAVQSDNGGDIVSSEALLEGLPVVGSVSLVLLLDGVKEVEGAKKVMGMKEVEGIGRPGNAAAAVKVFTHEVSKHRFTRCMYLHRCTGMYRISIA